MKETEQRIAHVKYTIQHCLSVIALCEAGGYEHAKASYEDHLQYLRLELAILNDELQKEETGSEV
jgi:hypothetical protein